MIEQLLTSLRYKSESTDIDFKQAQYRFASASDEEKSELLKDILAIANAWRDGTGYILIGFKDQRPHPAEVAGIVASDSIDDAKIQQFVNSKVKPKLTFRYEEHLYEGTTVGIISIPLQKRPFYLANQFGKLRKNIVYVRRGSSTDEAEPSEVTQMGLSDAGHGEMKVEIRTLTTSNAELPDTFRLDYLTFTGKYPDHESPRSTINGLAFTNPMHHDNRHFYREYAEYVRVEASAVVMKLEVQNNSGRQLSNAKLELTIEPLDGQCYELIAGRDLPEKPQFQLDLIPSGNTLQAALNRKTHRLTVDADGRQPTCNVFLGDLLPTETGKAMDTIAIVPRSPGRLKLRFKVLGAELPAPFELERIIETTGEVLPLDFDGFKAFVQKRLALLKAQSEGSSS